jgi:hypothetical protein
MRSTPRRLSFVGALVLALAACANSPAVATNDTGISRADVDADTGSPELDRDTGPDVSCTPDNCPDPSLCIDGTCNSPEDLCATLFDCHSCTDRSSCLRCCQASWPAGSAAAVRDYVASCGCSPTSECAAVCMGNDVCSAAGGATDQRCADCLGALTADAPCLVAFDTACGADASCVAYASCIDGCP